MIPNSKPATSPSARGEWRRRGPALVRRILAPPPKLTVSEWADRYRVISREASPEPGRWRTSRTPYLRGIMDAFSEPGIETVLCFTSAQIGKTEVMLNVLGFYVDQDPSPTLVVYPDLSVARDWSATRLAPMFRDTPKLRGRFRARSRSTTSTILHKVFPGGEVKIAGANAPASLATKPIRVLLCDEIDRYPPSAGAEGDPIALGRKRQANFWNRKIGLFTTPTNKGFSRGETAWEESDQREYHVPCPHCGVYQVLTWEAMRWEPGKPETAVMVCMKPDGCGAVIEEPSKREMLERGRWVAAKPGAKTAGFHIWSAYSPWVRWEELVREFLDAQGHPELLRVFVNTVLGELWEEAGERVDAHELFKRLEYYGAPVPSDACVLTCGVDVQSDRLEVRVWGWGIGEESWLVDKQLIPGDPGDTSAKGPWPALDAYLFGSFEHEDGATLGLSATFIDTGYQAKIVYAFVRDRIRRKIFASKGMSQAGRDLIGPPTHSNSARVNLFPVGTDTAKDLFTSQLRIQGQGPGYVHLPATDPDEDPAKQAIYSTDREELEQLTAEKKVTRYIKGRRVSAWMDMRHGQNHGLDCRVLAMAAFAALGAKTLAEMPKMLERVRAAGAKRRGEDPGKPPASELTKLALRQIRRRSNWVHGWR